MSTEMLQDYMSRCGDAERLAFTAALQCSPVFTGIKAAGLFVINQSQYAELTSMLQGSGVSCRCLALHREKAAVLLFRSKRLAAHLAKPEIAAYLREQGYQNGGLNRQLVQLSERYHAYVEHRAEFPHEMGVFLEYPLEDIRGFVEQNGKNCLFCGYWKVYSNESAAREKFRAYDEAKEEVLAQVIDGRSLRDITYSYTKKKRRQRQ